MPGASCLTVKQSTYLLLRDLLNWMLPARLQGEQRQFRSMEQTFQGLENDHCLGRVLLPASGPAPSSVKTSVRCKVCPTTEVQKCISGPLKDGPATFSRVPTDNGARAAVDRASYPQADLGLALEC